MLLPEETYRKEMEGTNSGLNCQICFLGQNPELLLLLVLQVNGRQYYLGLFGEWSDRLQNSHGSLVFIPQIPKRRLPKHMTKKLGKKKVQIWHVLMQNADVSNSKFGL